MIGEAAEIASGVGKWDFAGYRVCILSDSSYIRLIDNLMRDDFLVLE